jgi:ferredoxin
MSVPAGAEATAREGAEQCPEGAIDIIDDV